MDSNTERRAYAECRVEADGRKLVGHAIVFNSLSLDLGGFREYIAPEAVDRSLNEGADIRALVDHDTGKILARTRAGTLTLRKDSKGLKAIIEPDGEISYARDLLRSVARGDISGMSFGFRTISDTWDYESPEAQKYNAPIRTVTDMTISEISVVVFPAYDKTDVQAAMRSLNAFRSVHPMRTAQWYETKLRLAK